MRIETFNMDKKLINRLNEIIGLKEKTVDNTQVTLIITLYLNKSNKKKKHLYELYSPNLNPNHIKSDSSISQNSNKITTISSSIILVTCILSLKKQ